MTDSPKGYMLGFAQPHDFYVFGGVIMRKDIPMADELAPAVTALQRKLAEQLQSVADTKRTINMLLKMSGQPALYPESDNEHSGSVRSDQFYGKGVATSAAEYLAMRKQACHPEEILRALESGGFDFDVAGWKKDDRLRSLAISLAKNTGGAGKFHRLNNGAFGLRSWYDDDFLKKAALGAMEVQAQKARKKKARVKAKVAKAAKSTAVKADAKPRLVRSHRSEKTKDSSTLETEIPQEQSA